MILKGKTVVVYLQSPRERFWGILRDADPSGAVMEGIEIDSFESWAHKVAREGAGGRVGSRV